MHIYVKDACASTPRIADQPRNGAQVPRVLPRCTPLRLRPPPSSFPPHGFYGYATVYTRFCFCRMHASRSWNRVAAQLREEPE